MTRTRRKKLIFRSLDEFRSRYLPTHRKPRIVETPEEARILGANMVTKSMDKMDLKMGVSEVNQPR